MSDELLRIKNEISEAETSVNRLEGELQTHYKNMSDEFGVADLEQAEKKLQGWREEVATNQDKLDDGILELKEKMKPPGEAAPMRT